MKKQNERLFNLKFNAFELANLRISKKKVKEAKKIIHRARKIEAGEAILRMIGFVKEQIRIRPRARLFSKFILILTLLFLASVQAAEFVKEKEDEVVIAGRKILVAESNLPMEKPETGIGQEVVSKLSPFMFEKPVEGYVSQGYRAYHRANDFAAPFGSPISAVGRGAVIFAGRVSDGRGNMVVIDHGDGLKTAYSHMGKVAVGLGNQVEAKTYLGTVGMTGRTTGPHVHLEVFDNEVAVDPQSMLPR